MSKFSQVTPGFGKLEVIGHLDRAVSVGDGAEAVLE